MIGNVKEGRGKKKKKDHMGPVSGKHARMCNIQISVIYQKKKKPPTKTEGSEKGECKQR